jgi:hypothetical protein
LENKIKLSLKYNFMGGRRRGSKKEEEGTSAVHTNYMAADNGLISQFRFILHPGPVSVSLY